MPELHVIAAGLLLEFALSEIPSFGVGRISSMFMYPLSFFEFLDATGNKILRKAIQKAGFTHFQTMLSRTFFTGREKKEK